ncbi:hypothetical protein PAHAL_4G342200 [Panicum hallii]|uniref:Cytochrome P450 n=1 Tax=Panicum hallii TaxID=206008 RepID=A0A2T8JF17_9POAL|nr:hypothetical protein PAHAL_4G342200 [Panicum hallii]
MDRSLSTVLTVFEPNLQGDFNIQIMKDLFGDGILATDGKKWRHQRKLASYEFSTIVLRDFSSVVFRIHAAKLAEKISSAAADRTAIDMQKAREDILARFILASEEDPETINDRYLRHIVLSFLIPGKDTMASTLSWFFYMLCKNPVVQDKVAFEINESLEWAEEDNNIENFTARLNQGAIENMHYLHAAITETLRLYPAVPVDGKIANEDDMLPNGHRVIKGDGVNYMIYAMGRMKYLWGADAEEFSPERWLVNGIFQQENPYKFVSFNAGIRVCLGREFAYRQMKIMAATLVHFFRFKLEDESKEPMYKVMFTLHMDKGLHLYAYPRSA